MNGKARVFTVNPCVVCGYLFSDKHHLQAQRHGRDRPFGPGPTLYLCPNHHRYANMIQSLVEQEMTYPQLEEFAQRYFDEQFNRILRVLYEEAVIGPVSAMLGGIL